MRKLIENLIIILLILAIVWLCIGIINALSYSIEDNNCRDYSNRLEGFLQTLGIPVTIEVGYRSESKGHMWIAICGFDIDPITLLPMFFNPYDLKQKQYDDYNDYLDTRLS